MSNVTQEMFKEWERNSVTKLFKEAVQGRIEDAKMQLVNSDDPEFDRLVKGMVRAYWEVLDFKLGEDSDGDEV